MTIIITLWYCGILFINAHVNWLMLYRLSSLQTEEALKKAREKLEFLRDVMMIPRNLAGEIRQSLMLLLSSFLCTEFCMEFQTCIIMCILFLFPLSQGYIVGGISSLNDKLNSHSLCHVYMYI